MNLNEEYLEGQDTEVTDENTSVTLILKNEKDEAEQPQGKDSSAIDDITEENNDCNVVEQAEATEEYIDCNEANRESDSAEGKMDADANLSPKEYMKNHYSTAYSETKE